MKIALFDSHRFERQFFDAANQHHQFALTWFDVRLNASTAPMTQGFDVVSCFVNDQLDEKTLTQLQAFGIQLIALRCAGYNNVDLQAARRLGIRLVRVPAYSPHAVAEHAMALILCLNRKIHRAYQRVREQNFSLEGLVGFDLNRKTIGIIGTGKIGSVLARIAHGFGCRVLAYSQDQDKNLLADQIVDYVSFDAVLQQADILSLHVPLTPQTLHMIDEAALSRMKKGAFLINTGRGALIDSKALINALKSGKIGAAGLDVYEEEEDVFFEDLSDRVLQDDTLARLMTFPNVIITSHQGFLTEEALTNIATITLDNIAQFQLGRSDQQYLQNEVIVT